MLWVTNQAVCVDVGGKSPDVILRREWEPATPPNPGDTVEVLIESLDEDGLPRLSYRKARFDRLWREFVATHQEGDTVSATVTDQVTSGLLVDIGVPAFLPASQVDFRRPQDFAPFVGRMLECKILKIDPTRRAVVVSRRALLGSQTVVIRRDLLREIEPGQVRTGTVKHITDFVAYVDLGGIDGLLHVSDMSWFRVKNSLDVVQVNDSVEVFVLSVEREKFRIGLSLKHKTPNPWPTVVERFPVGSRQPGRVVALCPYGAWVQLLDGPEGLVHISHMSWRRSACVSEFVAVDDEIEVQVLSINPDKSELALGLREALPSRWMQVMERYPPGSVVSGMVRNLTNYGAFVELEPGVEGVLHLREWQQTRAVSHPREVVSCGERIACVVLNVDLERHRISLGPGDPATVPPVAPRPDLLAPLRIPDEVLRWGNGLVVRMARDIRDDRAFDAMPILADALEDAGCAEDEILSHLRDREAHTRRCWVLELLAGRVSAGCDPFVGGGLQDDQGA